MHTLKKRRVRVAVDLDGVIYDYHSTFKYIAETEFNVDLPSLTSWIVRNAGWDWYSRFLNKEQIEYMKTKAITERGLFRHGHVLKGAIDGLRKLSRDYDIIICTHRPFVAHQDTIEWIAFHRIPCKEIILLWNEEPKSEVDADVLIDDRPRNILDFVISGRAGVVWKRPWSEQEMAEIPDVYRPLICITNDWNQAKNFIDRVRMQHQED